MATRVAEVSRIAAGGRLGLLRLQSCRYTSRVVMNIRSYYQLFLAAVVLLAVPVSAGDESPVFKFYIEHTGVYEVPFESLAEAGHGGTLEAGRIGLTNLGQPVPLWVEDGGDGVFGPGDRLLFVGHVLRGSFSYLDPYSRYNCYVLETSVDDSLHGSTAPATADRGAEPAGLVAHHRLEPDRVMVRFRSRADSPEEEWYWERLSVADTEPFRQVVALDGLLRQRDRREAGPTAAAALAESVRTAGAEGAEDPSRIQSVLDVVFGETSIEATSVRLRIGLRGWSQPRHRESSALADHELQILLNGDLLDTARWDGTGHHVHELDVSSRQLETGANELALKVTKRTYPESGDLVVDVVLLNWIELEYEHQPRLFDEQLRLRTADRTAGRTIEIRAADDEAIDLYLDDGRRLRSGGGVLAATIPEGTAEFSVLGTQSAARPDEVILDRPSDLASTDRQADYIMITHRSLEQGAARLAEFHRSRGLVVDVVDVQDIYDEFNHGILDPEAIKDFLEHAYTRWRAPAPRFVLLIGDASWDFKNTTADDSNYADWTYRPGEMYSFVKNSSTSYAEGAEINHRNLVPTSSYLTLEGHAASDTWFVCFDEEKKLPEMAIGRIPVVTPAELDQVIDKTIAFASAAPVGPWRRNLLFIANESVGFQKRTDVIAEEYSRRGYVPTKIYPHPSEPANEHHTQRILDVFDSGVFAVHFIGHGGRYIWRTGPPDLKKNHDLFTLDHLDELAANSELPVVLSLTCYSAPFDHPTADSIGEKLMRIADSGAIAVFAASWRNSPSAIMGETLLAELTTPGNTIGEAVMRAKREFRSQVLVQTYNLLGDPAIPVAAPSQTLELELEPDPGDGGVTLRAEMPTDSGSYTVLADWVGADGTVLRQDRLESGGGRFSLRLETEGVDGRQELKGVRVYVWDENQRVDGIGWAEPPVAESAAAPLEGSRNVTTAVDEEPAAKSRESRESKGES